MEQELGCADSVSAPELLDLEVTNALGRLVAAKRLPAAIADDAVTDLYALRIARWPHRQLVHRIWTLRGQLTAYDAAYVALAEQLDADLVTTDGRLRRSDGHDARIRVFAG